LRHLHRKAGEYGQSHAAGKARKYVMAVGDRISGMADGEGGAPPHSALWDHVARTTEAPHTGEALWARYHKWEGMRGRGIAVADIVDSDGGYGSGGDYD